MNFLTMRLKIYILFLKQHCFIECHNFWLSGSFDLSADFGSMIALFYEATAELYGMFYFLTHCSCGSVFAHVLYYY